MSFVSDIENQRIAKWLEETLFNKEDVYKPLFTTTTSTSAAAPEEKSKFTAEEMENYKTMRLLEELKAATAEAKMEIEQQEREVEEVRRRGEELRSKYLREQEELARLFGPAGAGAGAGARTSVKKFIQKPGHPGKFKPSSRGVQLQSQSQRK